MPTTLVEIFRDSETHHRLSLFYQPLLKAIEAGLFLTGDDIAGGRAVRREVANLDVVKRLAKLCGVKTFSRRRATSRSVLP